MVSRNKSKKYNRSRKTSTRNKRQSRKNKHSTNKKGGVPDAVDEFINSMTPEERRLYVVPRHETDEPPVLPSSIKDFKYEDNAALPPVAAALPPVAAELPPVAALPPLEPPNLNPNAKEWNPFKGGKSNKRKKQSRKKTIHNKRK